MPIPEEIATILREANTCAQSSEQVSQSSHAENGGSANGNGIADNGSPCRSHDNDASGSGNRDKEDDPSLEWNGDGYNIHLLWRLTFCVIVSNMKLARKWNGLSIG